MLHKRRVPIVCILNVFEPECVEYRTDYVGGNSTTTEEASRFHRFFRIDVWRQEGHLVKFRSTGSNTHE